MIAKALLSGVDSDGITLCDAIAIFFASDRFGDVFRRGWSLAWSIVAGSGLQFLCCKSFHRQEPVRIDAA
jgi:hypothetical protein